jgi:hypothetical protein
MFGKSEDSSRSNAGQPSPATGLVFVLGCFGLFYGLIAVVDPLL